MQNLNKGVRGGTPVFSDPLCPTCSHAMYKKGAGKNEVILRCNMDETLMPFEAYECSTYSDKRNPYKRVYELDQIAWILVRNVKHQLQWFEPKEALELRRKGELKHTAVQGFMGTEEQ